MPRRTMTLLGPDVLLVAMGGARPNNAVLVIECGGRLEVARVATAVERLRALAPFMASRLERPLPWGRLRWAAADVLSPPMSGRRLAVGERLEDAIDALLNQRVDPWRDPPLRWQVVESADGGASWLVLAWVHPLMDPRGAELLVGMLDAVDKGGEAAQWAAARPVTPPDDPRPWRVRGALAQRALPALRTLARGEHASFGANGTSAGAVRHRRWLVRSRSRQLPLTLAVVSGAVARVLAARGLPLDVPFIVPVSVDRRRKGEPGPVFGNFVSFHFARVVPAETGDRGATVAAIRRDMAEAVRSDFVESLWAGMNFTRYHPPRRLLRPLGGREVASFHCADTGEVRPSLETLLGLPVRSAYHAPCVNPHPGLGLFFSRIADLESIVAVWVEGVVTAAEVERIVGDVSAGIEAAPAA